MLHGQKVFVGLQEHLQPNDASTKIFEGLNMCNATQGEESVSHCDTRALVVTHHRQAHASTQYTKVLKMSTTV